MAAVMPMAHPDPAAMTIAETAMGATAAVAATGAAAAPTAVTAEKLPRNAPPAHDPITTSEMFLLISPSLGTSASAFAGGPAVAPC